MLTKEQFAELNFFEKIENFNQYKKELPNVPQNLIDEATQFFDLLKEHNLRKYKIHPVNSNIFINQEDFGLKIVHADFPGREIFFNFGEYETPITFNDPEELCYDGIYGQGTIATGEYLIKNLANTRKITRQGKYQIEDVLLDDQNNIVEKIYSPHLFDLFYLKKILNLLPDKTTKIINWK